MSASEVYEARLRFGWVARRADNEFLSFSPFGSEAIGSRLATDNKLPGLAEAVWNSLHCCETPGQGV
jgi:hypothetical protein